MRVAVAVLQMPCGAEFEENLERAELLARRAAAAGANIVLLQEMFAHRFFGFNDWKSAHFALAEPQDGPTVTHMARVARELGVVIPVSFYERANSAYYNSVMVLDADGARLGVYRKTHIPAGPPGCYEKIYTNPGDTGFRVWRTAFGPIGVGVCWDQWFPEAARCMALMGAELLLYPTAIGSSCHGHWSAAIRGHAAANLTPVAVANRIGRESGELGESAFWGRSFIAGPFGETAAEAEGAEEGFALATFDLEAIREARANWGVFRDRRPETYGPLLTVDGRTPFPGLPTPG